MATKPSPARVVAALLDRSGQSFAEELGIPVERNQPSPLFRLLTAAILLSANLDARLGLRTARALSQAGYRTAPRMAEASDRERWEVLAEARYLRKERTAGILGDAARQCVERYDGDLRELREAAERDPARERELLQEFKGIGPVGADIFLREAQVAWTELYPFADERVTAPARRLGLPGSAGRLGELTGGPRDFARLTAALVRCNLADDYDAVRAAARER